MTVEVIIPNFNGSPLIAKNLPKIAGILEKVSITATISIVDDYSEMQDYLALKEIIKKHKSKKIPISLFRNEKNLGFSSTVNKAALLSSADYLLLLNTDVVPIGDFLSPLIEDMEEDIDLFGVGCLDESMENGKKVYRGRGVGFWKKGFFVHKKGDIEKKDTQWISGGSALVRRTYFVELGGFDEIYNPFYWEDIDLSYRALKKGYKLMFDKRSRVLHEHNVGSIKSTYQEITVKTIAYRNQIIFVWKNITDFKLLLSHFIYLPAYLIRSGIKGDSAFIIGFLMAIKRLPQILEKRRLQRKSFTKKDWQILSK